MELIYRVHSGVFIDIFLTRNDGERNSTVAIIILNFIFLSTWNHITEQLSYFCYCFQLYESFIISFKFISRLLSFNMLIVDEVEALSQLCLIGFDDFIRYLQTWF
jgi:hypothetical protein